jgi:benzoyl-CoA-dihydrodiol lyase
VAEGVKGKRAVDWKLVDFIAPKSGWAQAIQKHASRLATLSNRPGLPALGQGVKLESVAPAEDGTSFTYKYVSLVVDTKKRTADITIKAPDAREPTTGDNMRAKGSELWCLRAYRELDDAILRLRLNFLDVGFITLRTSGDPTYLLEAERNLLAAQDHWFARETLAFMKRVLKRLDVTSRTFLALVEPGSCFAGSLAELLFLADRTFMLDDSEAEKPAQIVLSAMSDGPLPMGNGLTRLQTRFYGDDRAVAALKPYMLEGKPIDVTAAEKLGLVTFVRDEIDYPDEVRLFVEERTALSPDALTGMEQNLRWPGPETMETRIFGRLSAWQNWIFIRDNATGPTGALSLYGKPQRPQFDTRRT